jgi:hypothetical protein
MNVIATAETIAASTEVLPRRTGRVGAPGHPHIGNTSGANAPLVSARALLTRAL